MSIQRYGAYGTQAEPEGEFVTHADYEANAARLGEALELSDAELAKWMARAAMEETQRRHAEAELEALRADAERMRGAIRWALGEGGEFGEEPPPLAGKYRQRYWWRTELRKRAFADEARKGAA